MTNVKLRRAKNFVVKGQVFQGNVIYTVNKAQGKFLLGLKDERGMAYFTEAGAAETADQAATAKPVDRLNAGENVTRSDSVEKDPEPVKAPDLGSITESQGAAETTVESDDPAPQADDGDSVSV